jgi:hypothetical protein
MGLKLRNLTQGCRVAYEHWRPSRKNGTSGAWQQEAKKLKVSKTISVKGGGFLSTRCA